MARKAKTKAPAKKPPRQGFYSQRGVERARTTMRLSVPLMAQLTALAESQNRTVANLVETVLDAHARKNRVATDLFD